MGLLWVDRPASAGQWVHLKGLDDMSVSVAIASAPSRHTTLAEVLEQDLFEDLTQVRRRPLHSVVSFWRIDLHTPKSRDGETVWLRAVPPLIWDADLLTPDGERQHGGMVFPDLQAGRPGFPTQFEVRLTYPLTRLYFHIDTALPELTHISVLSDEALSGEVQRDTLRQGSFIGAAMLMLVLTLANWVFTRRRIYRDFAIYIACVSLFMLCFNGYLTAYFLVNYPTLVARLSLVSFVMAVSSTVWFSLSVLDLRRQMPRTATWLTRFLLLVVAVALPGLNLDWLGWVSKVLWLTYLPVGLLLLGLSAHLAWKLRSVKAWLAFAAFLSFSVFEKAPLLSMAGLLPLSEWTPDIAKIGFVFYMLLTHLYLLIHLGDQRELERRAMAARLEAEAERNQRRDLAQFLSMFGHEVRTPLSIIDAATQSLEMMAGSDAPKVQVRHKRIRNAVERLNLLSREALARERIESGSWTARPRVFDIHHMIEGALGMQCIAAPDFSLGERMSVPATVGGSPEGSFEVEIAAGFSEMEADPDMIELALSNLIDNACKYADPGSGVRLLISTVPGEDGEPSCALFEVLSRGQFLTSEELARVFDKYWRRSEVQGVAGAGLGLHLVRLISRAHGGWVRARSLPDRWTSFSLFIPLKSKVISTYEGVQQS